MSYRRRRGVTHWSLKQDVPRIPPGLQPPPTIDIETLASHFQEMICPIDKVNQAIEVIQLYNPGYNGENIQIKLKLTDSDNTIQSTIRPAWEMSHNSDPFSALRVKLPISRMSTEVALPQVTIPESIVDYLMATKMYTDATAALGYYVDYLNRVHATVNQAVGLWDKTLSFCNQGGVAKDFPSRKTTRPLVLTEESQRILDRAKAALPVLRAFGGL